MLRGRSIWDAKHRGPAPVASKSQRNLNLQYQSSCFPTPPSGGASTIGTNQYASAATGPYDQPIDNTPGTANYGTNNVVVTLANGTQNTLGYSLGPTENNPYSKTFIHGPMNWTIDLSLFKVFPITEKVNLRFNMDAFNALNMQGYNNPSATDGTESLLSSYNTPRQVQFTLRLTF